MHTTSNKLLLIILTLTFSLMGCASATKFSGDAKIEDGPAQCENLCGKWNMVLVGMVELGEYTNGCICKKGAHMSILDTVNPLLISAIGTGV